MTKQTKSTVKMHDELKGVRYGSDASAEGVKKAIDQAVSSVRKGRVDVQKAAVLILLHAYKHGDWRKANDLVNALGNSINARALVEWFETYGGLLVDEEAGAFGGWSGADFIKEYFDAAKATPWWTLKPINPWKGFDLNAELLKVLKAHKRAQERAEGDEAAAGMIQLQVDTDVAAQLKALLQQA